MTNIDALPGSALFACRSSVEPPMIGPGGGVLPGGHPGLSIGVHAVSKSYPIAATAYACERFVRSRKAPRGLRQGEQLPDSVLQHVALAGLPGARWR
jgi:hypothetical protein